ncbi:hypothetical protein RRG08_039483 [Elysia crispata]|uniref:Uncharacterized protein n=1 Tax=Elysia crispata TaxID=231223 RepID=A0AAE1D024_9GAST|nr:hypothetical protein RRG08_039483 [Elysia crispata]
MQATRSLHPGNTQTQATLRLHIGFINKHCTGRYNGGQTITNVSVISLELSIFSNSDFPKRPLLPGATNNTLDHPLGTFEIIHCTKLADQERGGIVTSYPAQHSLQVSLCLELTPINQLELQIGDGTKRLPSLTQFDNLIHRLSDIVCPLNSDLSTYQTA